MTGRDFIRHAGLEPFVDHIVTVEDVRECKPNPEGIFAAMQTLKCGPECTWMVGDTEIDILAGKNAGIPTIGVDFTGTGSPFKEHLPTHFITSPREIIPILLRP